MFLKRYKNGDLDARLQCLFLFYLWIDFNFKKVKYFIVMYKLY